MAFSGKLAKIQKQREDLEEKKLALSAILLQAQAPDVQAGMPPASIKKAVLLAGQVDEKLQKSHEILQSKTCTKAILKEWSDSHADLLKSVTGCTSLLETLVSDASP